MTKKIINLSDKWSLEQLIDVQNRITSHKNAASIKSLEDLHKRVEEALKKDKT